MLIDPIEPFKEKIWKEAGYKLQKNKKAPS